MRPSPSAALNSTDSPADFDGSGSEEDVLYQRDAVLDVLEAGYPNTTATLTSAETPPRNVTPSSDGTTQGPGLEQKLTEVSGAPGATLPVSTEAPCPLDCGPGGGCSTTGGTTEGGPRCLCPLGRGGDRCEEGEWNGEVKWRGGFRGRVLQRCFVGKSIFWCSL